MMAQPHSFGMHALLFVGEGGQMGIHVVSAKPPGLPIEGSGANVYVHPTEAFTTYPYFNATSITGLTVADLARGMSFEDAQASVKAICGPGAVLVGQGIDGDIEWWVHCCCA